MNQIDNSNNTFTNGHVEYGLYNSNNKNQLILTDMK
jgi:hypothetical protein